MMIPRRARPVLLLALMSCSTLTGEDWTREPGFIDVGLSAITAPASVQVNTDFQITVRSFGSSTCTRADGHILNLSPSLAAIWLFDLVAPPGTACTDDLREFPRTLAIRFTATGTATIELNGSGSSGQPRLVSTTVEVTPAP